MWIRWFDVRLGIFAVQAGSHIESIHGISALLLVDVTLILFTSASLLVVHSFSSSVPFALSISEFDQLFVIDHPPSLRQLPL